ncbi:MAG: serine/threonine protein kinase, partial [Pirellula sp.]|nr:serine/threonine protein kinase [Pirellula sp.]
MRHCPKCNAINEDDAATCIQCGAALPRGSADFQTIDVIGAPLAEDAEIHATLDVDAAASANPIAKTFNGDMSFDGDVSIDVGQLAPNQTVEYAAHATDAGADGEATLMLDDNTAAPIHAAQTLLQGTEGTDQRTIQNKLAKTVGQLEKVWASAAGSSVNPMQSLSGASMQAMDSIFERVAVRKVLDANSSGLSDADYRIIDKLGEGGMGIVFTARQTAVDRLVALKAAKPKFQKSRDARKRFLYEAQITADLDHSNIVPIHDLGVSEDGMLFYSMKIVDGDQWSQVMANQTREQNLDIFMKVADAVAFAHSKGIIHRDLKPENTMLGKFGEVFVTDWGTAVNLKRDSSRVTEPAIAGESQLKIESTEHFRGGESIAITTDDEVLERNEIQSIQDCEIRLAKPLGRSSQLTANLRIVKAFNLAGTPCYMAPEMAGHQLNRIGPASDIYVLGAILFDMVTGRPPHTGPTVTHCLMNALGNQLVIPEDAGDDALLSIALKAMS